MPGVKYALRREWAYLGPPTSWTLCEGDSVLRAFVRFIRYVCTIRRPLGVHPDLRKSLIQTKYSLKSRRNLRRADSDSADDDPRNVARKACVPNISKCARDPVLNGL